MLHRILDTSLLKYNGDGIGFSIQQRSDGKLEVTVPSRSATEIVATDSFVVDRAFNVGVWYFISIVYTFDSGLVKVYVNEAGTTAGYEHDIGQRVLATAGNIQIGGGSDDSFEGGLSCLQFYDNSYDESHVFQNFQTCNIGRFTFANFN